MDVSFILKFMFFLNFGTNFVVDSCNESPKPEMHISTIPNHLRFIRENTVLVEKLGAEVQIDCWAPFPINIEFKGHLSNRESKVNLIKRTATNHLDPSTFCFQINTTVTAYEEITGNYSCFAVNDSSLKTSFYIFYSPKPSASLLNRGQLLTVTTKYEDSIIVIPCPTANPNVSVHLYNEHNEKLNLTKYSIDYDPKIGFKVPKSNEFIGHFQCRTELTANDKVDVRIVQEKKSIFWPSQDIIILREGDLLKVSCESTEDILMEMEFTNPQLGKLPQINNNKNSTSQYKYNLKYESDALRKGDTGRISCRTKLSKSEEGGKIHEWSISVRQGKDSNKSESILDGFNSYLCQNSRKSALKLYACDNWIECNMRKCSHNDHTCSNQECNNVNTFQCLPNGIVQCFDSHNESLQQLIYFSGLGKIDSYTNWKMAPISDILRIQTIRLLNLNSEDAAVSEVEMSCEGSSFVVAVGFQWFLKVMNGSDVQIPEAQIQHKWKSTHEKYVIKSIANTALSANITHVVCKAPIWNSTEWIEDVISLQEPVRNQL